MLSRDPSKMGRAEILALVDRVDELEETVRQLREYMAPLVLVPRAWRLTHSEQRLLLAIRGTGRTLLTKERALVALYGLIDSDTPEQKILDVFICKIRRKLMEAQTRIEIETVWGRGWRLTAESLDRLNAIIEADVATGPSLPPLATTRLSRSAA